VTYYSDRNSEFFVFAIFSLRLWRINQYSSTFLPA